MLPSGEKISVVMPAYNEEAGIGGVIESFVALGYIDEIVVVDNNSTDSTARIAAKLGARVVVEPRRGYGSACIRALNEAMTDIVVLVESEGTFDAADLGILLTHLQYADVVSGSRIHSRCNKPGADMTWYKILGNRALGALATLLYGNKYMLDDIGSSYVVARKEIVDKVKEKLRVTDSSFSAELYIGLIGSGASIKQVPISYGPRIG